MYCAPLPQVSQAANDGWEAFMKWCRDELSRDHDKRVMWQPVLLRLCFFNCHPVTNSIKQLAP